MTDIPTGDRERDDLVRTQPCPVCGVGPTRRCFAGRTSTGRPVGMATSHEGRYWVAVDVGLVPPLVGAR